MVVRKIVHVDEALCNGCGQCIPKCLEGALKIVDGKAKIIRETYCDGLGACLGRCPQSAITIIEREADAFDKDAVLAHLPQAKVNSAEKTVLPQWPVKFELVPLEAPFYENSHLLIAADCAPVAITNIQDRLLSGKRILIGCPKFGDVRAYAQKLAEILKRNNVAEVTVAHMEVPCCSGLKWVVDTASKASGKQIPVKRCVITVGGEISEL